MFMELVRALYSTALRSRLPLKGSRECVRGRRTVESERTDEHLGEIHGRAVFRVAYGAIWHATMGAGLTFPPTLPFSSSTSHPCAAYFSPSSEEEEGGSGSGSGSDSSGVRRDRRSGSPRTAHKAKAKHRRERSTRKRKNTSDKERRKHGKKKRRKDADKVHELERRLGRGVGPGEAELRQQGAVLVDLEGFGPKVGAFFFDSHGDRDNLAYDSLYRLNVPSYRCSGAVVGEDGTVSKARHRVALRCDVEDHWFFWSANSA